MITEAETRGDLRPGMTILECSTGNTGIACAFISSVKGYRCSIVMPEGMSEERKKMDRYFTTELCGEAKHVEVPERDHPMDPHTVSEYLSDHAYCRARKGAGQEVEEGSRSGGGLHKYEAPSYNGFRLSSEKYYPSWVLDEKHLLVRSAWMLFSKS